jgi:nucleoside-diphosphate-sugar epimerase
VKQYALLTGATGLVGRYLMRDLMLAGHRLAVVVRGSDREGPVERIESILQMWEDESGSSLPRPVVLEGDVTEPLFGLSARCLAWAREHCDRILHNAASMTFYNADRSGEPWRTNLKGAEHAIDLCSDLQIDEFHHVSTAYVAGLRNDLVLEDELDVGQGFRNDYEESKFLCEKLLHSVPFLRSLTVYRPAVIVGDSITGYTSTYHGLYHHLKLMSVVNRNVEPDENGVRHTPVQLQMTGNEPRNMVPVDWVSAVISRIFGQPSAHGRTYHLSPRECVTPRAIVEAGCRYYNSYGVEFVGPESRSAMPISGVDLAAQETMRVYSPYENSDPTFDTTNLQRAAPDLICPAIDDAMLRRFLDFGEQDRWGKRREPRPNVPFWVEKYLEKELSRRHPETREGRRDRTIHVIGLDVYGPGGGQWRLEFHGERLTSATQGLPADQFCVNLSSADFARLVQKYERLTAQDLQVLDQRDRLDRRNGEGSGLRRPIAHRQLAVTHEISASPGGAGHQSLDE